MKASRLVVIALAVAGFTLNGCDNASLMKCERRLHGQTLSPDGKLKAIIVDVQCGATNEDANWILLTDADREFDANRDRIAVFEGSVGRMTWRGNDLIVAYGTAKPFSLSKAVKGVRIVYEGDEVQANDN